MHTNNATTRLIMGFLTCVLLGTGCTAPMAVNTEPRLTHLEQTESSFVATVEHNASRITILVERSGPRAEGFTRDPEIDSPFESDISIRNRYDYPFLRTFSGDVPAVLEDSNEANAAPSHISQDEQLEDLRLVIDATTILENHADIGERFRWELREVRNMAAGSLERALDASDGHIIPRSTPDAREIESETIGSISVINEGTEGATLRSSDSVSASRAYLGSTYIHVASIRWANCCWGFGQHSAVLVDVYTDTWMFVGTISTKNHGREANDSSMAVASGCPVAWGGRANVMPPLQPYVSTDTYDAGDAGGCGTPYDAIPPTTGGHVCNDDSLVEYWHVKYNASGSWATCGDSTLRDTAPSCN